jgi:hypothetical protein
MQQSYDQGRHDVQYMAGDKILLHVVQLPKGRTPKLAKPWQGPYRVSEVKIRLVRVVQNVHNPCNVQMVNVNRVKMYNDGDSIAVSLDSLHTQQDDQGEDLEVYAIIDDRVQDNRRQYLIRFKGFSARYMTPGSIKRTSTRTSSCLCTSVARRPDELTTRRRPKSRWEE